MFARAALRTSPAVAAPVSVRLFSQSATANRNVAVLGASGGIGQPVRMNPINMVAFASHEAQPARLEPASLRHPSRSRCRCGY